MKLSGIFRFNQIGFCGFEDTDKESEYFWTIIIDRAIFILIYKSSIF